MASTDLSLLVPEVKDRAYDVVKRCQEQGVTVFIYCTYRSLEEQALLYRQSRSWRTIKEKINKFEQRGLDTLADVLRNTGVRSGPHVTNSCCGESGHNYGTAFDAIVVNNGKLCPKYKGNPDPWNIYGRCVRESGLYWGGDWQEYREYHHAQLRPGSNPLKVNGAPRPAKDVIRELEEYKNGNI